MLWGKDSFEKGTSQESSLSKEIAAPKKQLLCRSSYSEEMWRSSFSQNKVVLKKLLNMQEGKSPFKKKQINLVITFN